MRAPAGNSQHSSSQSKSSDGGEIERRRKPVAGSTHSGCSPRLTSAGASPSMSASRRETVVRCAPASRPSTDAVGLTSPFSIREREARLTPLSAESSSSDQRRARRNCAQALGEAHVGGVERVGRLFPYQGKYSRIMRMSKADVAGRLEGLPQFCPPPSPPRSCCCRLCRRPEAPRRSRAAFPRHRQGCACGKRPAHSFKMEDWTK